MALNNHLYIDCSTGIAGDMLTSALIDMMNDQQRRAFLEKSNNLLSNTKTKFRKIKKFNLDGTTVDVVTDKNTEEFSKDVHSETISSLKITSNKIDAINPFKLIDEFDINDQCKKNIQNIFELLMKTESFVHNSPDQHSIHFNRIGSIDALIDISNICILLNMLDIKEITASPVNTGYGQVKYNKKVFQVPAPATKKLLEDIPNYYSDIYGELCTPTGISVLKYFSNDFHILDISNTIIKEIGIGFGQKVFNHPTFVKCLLVNRRKLA
ncbi:nickel insertion protein [Companilactobacillus muriivasis]|uniref:nickel insertion protein n=1 Tax=Companilactobacillus muriivasis TaxID=3081444 RepID=UPI0030C6BC72